MNVVFAWVRECVSESVSVIPKRDRLTGVFGEGGCVRESIEVMN